MGWILKRTDILFAIAIVAVMTILIMPLSAFFMDCFLSLSFTFSIMILMTVLFIGRPLDFNSFPTIILISTMFRLALTIASTRLILSHGHESTSAAGHVIEAFGEFVMEGNFVIGLIVFFILIVVNFVVITKGSGRIAEVSARFTLDAMPGKQMAIDADLSSGLISDTEAKMRRKTLEAESNFYGSMDGAGKFVRGDAIAGVLITFINIIGGIIIGVLQNDMSFIDAARSYTLLSVGDGLVTQIPALLVSAAAGLLVTKGGNEETSNTMIFRQMGSSVSALGMTSGIIAFLGILPGVPFFPFMVLSSAIGSAAWFSYQKKTHESNLKKEPQALMEASPVSPPIDLIRLELGYGLLSLLEANRSIKLNDQIKRLREQIAKDMGVILPAVRIQDNLTLDQNDYVIKIKEVECGKGTIKPDKILLLDAKNRPLNFPGEDTKEPAFGLVAKWIDPSLKEKAEDAGHTIVDPAIVISTHLSEITKDNMTDLFTYTDVQYLLDNVTSSYKKLLSEMIPGQMTVSNIQRVLQNLITERVSIRDLPTILEGIFEASSMTRNITAMTEHVRQRLSRQITFQFANPQGVLSALALSQKWEDELTQSLIGEGDMKHLAIAPSKAQEFIQSVRSIYKTEAENPVLVSAPHLRVHVKSLLEHARPKTIVLGKNEIHPKAQLHFVGQV